MPPEPLTRGLPPPDPLSLCPLSSTEFIDPPPEKKFLGTPLYVTALELNYVTAFSGILKRRKFTNPPNCVTDGHTCAH